MKVIILAGGEGKRLQPLSTPQMPKQFISLDEKGSCLQKTLFRMQKIVSDISDFLVVTQEKYVSIVQAQVRHMGLGALPIIGEKYSRNTAFALALGVKYLEPILQPNEPILVVPSDHVIFPEDLFIQKIQKTIVSHDPQKFTLFGIPAEKLSAHYGYMEKDSDGYVTRFVEKPSLDEQMPLSSHLFVNLGMVLMQKEFFLSQLSAYFPSLYSLYLDPISLMQKKAKDFPHISLDHAILEKTPFIDMTSLEGIFWRDIGLWETMQPLWKKNHALQCLVT